MKSQIEFAELVNQIASGDREAVIQFIQLYRGRTYSIAYSVCHHREDTEDIVQEVFVKLLMLEPIKFPSSGHASWFYVLTKNTALDYLKKKRPTDNIECVQLPDPHAENEIAYFEAIDQYENLVSKLNSEEKLIVGLKVLGGMKHKEIASMLKRPTGTIQWIYHRAIHALRISLSSLVFFIVALLFTVYQNGKAMANEHYFALSDPLFWSGWVMVISCFISIYFLVVFIRQKIIYKS